MLEKAMEFFRRIILGDSLIKSSNLTAIMGVIILGLNFFELWVISLILLNVGTFFYVYAFFSHEGETDNQIFSLLFFITMAFLHIAVFSEIYKHYGIINADGDLVKKESEALYFSFVTWTTLGYGDFRPSVNARPYAAFEAMMGYLYMGLFVGKVIHLLSKAKPKEK